MRVKTNSASHIEWEGDCDFEGSPRRQKDSTVVVLRSRLSGCDISALDRFCTAAWKRQTWVLPHHTLQEEEHVESIELLIIWIVTWYCGFCTRPSHLSSVACQVPCRVGNNVTNNAKIMSKSKSQRRHQQCKNYVQIKVSKKAPTRSERKATTRGTTTCRVTAQMPRAHPGIGQELPGLRNPPEV